MRTPLAAALAFTLAHAPALSAQRPAELSQQVRTYVTVDAPVVALTNVRVVDEPVRRPRRVRPLSSRTAASVWWAPPRRSARRPAHTRWT